MIDQAKPLLTVSELHKYFGAVRASDAVSFEVYPGEVHAIIGPNGAGKTTLIAQLSGFLNPDSGQMWFDGFDLSAHQNFVLNCPHAGQHPLNESVCSPDQR